MSAGRQARRFLVAGFATVCVDALSYAILLRFGFDHPTAKALGFLSGTTFAWFVNRLFTFSAPPQPFSSVLRFAALYGGTLVMNVAVNELVRLGWEAVWSGMAASLSSNVGFLAATAASATANFFGMRLFVFRGTDFPSNDCGIVEERSVSKMSTVQLHGRRERATPRLSIVIPCYNEAAGLPALIERCELLSSGGAEVILVDNGSTDGTGEALLAAGIFPARPYCGKSSDGSDSSSFSPGIRSVRVDVNQGYGFGILSGLAMASGDVLGWTHADMQADPADALRGFGFFLSSDHPERLFIKGRRHGRPFADVAFTIGMSLFESTLFGSRLWDVNAQPTLFHRSFMEGWSDPPMDFSLDLFAYATARSRGLSVSRFPVFFGERMHGRSHWNVDWRAKARFIRRTLLYSFGLKKKFSDARRRGRVE